MVVVCLVMWLCGSRVWCCVCMLVLVFCWGLLLRIGSVVLVLFCVR